MSWNGFPRAVRNLVISKLKNKFSTNQSRTNFFDENETRPKVSFILNLIIDNSRILHTTNSRTPNFLLLLEAIYIKYHSPSLNTGPGTLER